MEDKEFFGCCFPHFYICLDSPFPLALPPLPPLPLWLGSSPSPLFGWVPPVPPCTPFPLIFGSSFAHLYVCPLFPLFIYLFICYCYCCCLTFGSLFICCCWTFCCVRLLVHFYIAFLRCHFTTPVYFAHVRLFLFYFTFVTFALILRTHARVFALPWHIYALHLRCPDLTLPSPTLCGLFICWLYLAFPLTWLLLFMYYYWFALPLHLLPPPCLTFPCEPHRTPFYLPFCLVGPYHPLPPHTPTLFVVIWFLFLFITLVYYPMVDSPTPRLVVYYHTLSLPCIVCPFARFICIVFDCGHFIDVVICTCSVPLLAGPYIYAVGGDGREFYRPLFSSLRLPRITLFAVRVTVPANTGLLPARCRLPLAVDPPRRLFISPTAYRIPHNLCKHLVAVPHTRFSFCLTGDMPGIPATFITPVLRIPPVPTIPVPLYRSSPTHICCAHPVPSRFLLWTFPISPLPHRSLLLGQPLPRVLRAPQPLPPHFTVMPPTVIGLQQLVRLVPTAPPLTAVYVALFALPAYPSPALYSPGPSHTPLRTVVYYLHCDTHPFCLWFICPHLPHTPYPYTPFTPPHNTPLHTTHTFPPSQTFCPCALWFGSPAFVAFPLPRFG